MRALEVDESMKSSIHTLAIVLTSFLMSACVEDIPDVECGWVLPEPATQRVPSRSGFNLRIQVIGTYTADQIPAVRFFSDVEAANSSYPDGMLLESGIAVDEAVGCATGCLAGGRLETAITPGQHQITARALTPRGNTACETTITVTANSPPMVSAITLVPGSPGTADNIDFTAEVSDADGDTYQVSNTWTGPESKEPLLGSTLTPLHTTVGEVWRLSVSADDGTDRGDPLEQEFTIANTAPETPTVTIHPSPARLDSTLSCAVTDLGALDPDDQPLETHWSWQVDSVDAGITAPEVDGSETAAGEVWSCTAVISDGIDESGPGGANTAILPQLSATSPIEATSLPLIAGVSPNQSLGDSGQTGSPGDINGDGFTDFVLTTNADICQTVAPFDCNGQAHAYLFTGSNGGAPTAMTQHVTDFQPPPGIRIHAPARIGDLNGDGIDDLTLAYRTANALTTATEEIDTWNPGSGTSGIYLVFGDAAGYDPVVDLEVDAVKITATAESWGTLLSPSPCPVGDLDGDGFDDLAVTAPGHDNSRGSLFVIYGHPGSWLSGLSPGSLQPSFRVRGGPQNLQAGELGDGLGLACSGRIDLNADGHHDLVVGAPRGGAEGNGWVLVFFGDGSRWDQEVTSAMADIIISGETIQASDPTALTTNFGRALAALGDYDGDGVDDLAISGLGPVLPGELNAGDDDDSASAEPSEQDGGTVWIASGGASSLVGSVTSSSLPYRIEGDGDMGFCGLPCGIDIDGDGLGDLVCADTRADRIVELSPAGVPAVRLFTGTLGTIDATRSYTSANLVLRAAGTDHRFGASVARVGDFDGDLYEELLIGSPGLDAPLADGGGVYIVDLNP